MKARPDKTKIAKFFPFSVTCYYSCLYRFWEPFLFLCMSWRISWCWNKNECWKDKENRKKKVNLYLKAEKVCLEWSSWQNSQPRNFRYCFYFKLFIVTAFGRSDQIIFAWLIFKKFLYQFYHVSTREFLQVI